MYTNLIGIKTISPEINAVINNFATYREEMLKALEHPGLPLHTNDSERDIRSVAKRRNLSGSTKSDPGRKFRDGLLTIKQTCFRLGYTPSTWILDFSASVKALKVATSQMSQY
jgi:hypothetical protein